MDPLSVAASVLALATFCVQSSASLYKTIDGMKSYKQEVRNLKTEVGDLNVVLQALEKNIEESTENFEMLRLILQNCGQACNDFEKAVLNAFGDSKGRLQEVKNWAKLQYLGSDISSFRKLISSYKATVTIALADANLKTVKITKQLLETYTEMTKETTSDLEDQIAELSTKLQSLQSAHSSTVDTQLKEASPTAQQAVDQKISLEQCLNVCHSLLDHIENAKASILEDTSNASATITADSFTDGIDILAPRLTSDVLKICEYNLNATTKQLHDLREGQRPLKESDEARILKQLNTAQQCLDIVAKAQQQPRVCVYEDVDVAEDSFQTIVSTIGDLIKVKGLTIGARTVNIMGQMNDDSLQSITVNFRPPTFEKIIPSENKVSFEEKHGYGHTMYKRKP